MEKKDSLTNEKLQNRFTSMFDLVNYAIEVAENMILTGREPNTITGVQNRAVQVLDEISKNKETFNEIKPEATYEPELPQPTRESIVQKAEIVKAKVEPEKKKEALPIEPIESIDPVEPVEPVEQEAVAE